MREYKRKWTEKKSAWKQKEQEKASEDGIKKEAWTYSTEEVWVRLTSNKWRAVGKGVQG